MGASGSGGVTSAVTGGAASFWPEQAVAAATISRATTQRRSLGCMLGILVTPDRRSRRRPCVLALPHASRRQHDEEPPISAVDGYHAVEIAEACYESASAKEPVEIEADDDDDTPEDWDEC